jgi:hypothetical protein
MTPASAVISALQVFQVAGTNALCFDQLIKNFRISKHHALALTVGLVATSALLGLQGVGLGILSFGLLNLEASLYIAASKKFQILNEAKRLLLIGVSAIAFTILANRLLGGNTLLPMMRIQPVTQALFAGLVGGVSAFCMLRYYFKKRDLFPPSLAAAVATTSGLFVPSLYVLPLGIGLSTATILK